VADALRIAKAGGRVVLVEFGASWCVWCTKFNAFVNAPEVKPIIAANYHVVTLTVQEAEAKKALENPGGDTFKTKWGGARAGLPFYAFLDGAGNKLADSNAMPDGSNIGFPANAKELAAFVALIDKTAPKLSATDRKTVVDYLERTVPK
jgi:hypothetical protein